MSCTSEQQGAGSPSPCTTIWSTAGKHASPIHPLAEHDIVQLQPAGLSLTVEQHPTGQQVTAPEGLIGMESLKQMVAFKAAEEGSFLCPALARGQVSLAALPSADGHPLS